ncbi:thioesterase-3 [Plasticicumulans lactativorans]|uniref:Thioesterase-3 n=1 Tax=Plasticicumulans lactativorans TaxID=1133106 RepID=A0A4R2LAM6_9GAMM|nr:thioesterase family protein [Plasticicumulans lactativorans]TCO81379.1 thioesterase-3 [Plasticicumulans lactativorans]
MSLPTAAAGHETRIKVRGYHLDVYGHVNNARHLEFLEEGRWAWFEANNDLARFQERGWGFAVVNINIDYRRPAFMGEVLVVRSTLAKLGRRSAVIHQRVTLADTDTVVVEADVTFVVTDRADGRAVAIEGELRALFAGLVATPAADG